MKLITKDEARPDCGEYREAAGLVLEILNSKKKRPPFYGDGLKSQKGKREEVATIDDKEAA